MKSYPLQVFRHRIYLPWLSMQGHFGDIKRGIVTQKIIELNEIGIDPSVGTRFETISYEHLKTSLSCSDIDNFNIPAEKLVIYLFNPFGEERMTNLVAKLVRREEETLVIYHNPKHFECFKNQRKIKTQVWNHFGL